MQLGCLKFRDSFLSETNVDPFTYCTIAASVMAIYQSKYLKKDTISIVPRNMYHGGNKPFSKSSIEWIEFISYQTKSKTLHNANGGEKQIFDDELGKVYYVDGFDENENIVYSFYGCLYHACPLCFDSNSKHPFCTEHEMRDVYQKTIDREKRLQDMGYIVKTIWEHDYKKLKKSNEMKIFLDEFEPVTDIDPRDAFFRRTC